MQTRAITPDAAFRAATEEDEENYEAAVKSINEDLSRSFRGTQISVSLGAVHWKVLDRVLAAFRLAGWVVKTSSERNETIAYFERSRPAATL